jgi:hypothetical protein
MENAMVASGRLDFMSAMGQSFGESVSPPVPFEDASPHECCEAVWRVVGRNVTPEMLDGLSEKQLTSLAHAFGEWFDCEPPSVAQIRKGVARTLARWPVGSLDDRDSEADAE